MRQIKIGQSITNRDSDSFDRYLTDISKIPLLTAEQEEDLARRIRRGDAVALELLIKANLRFVISVAKKYQSTTLQLGDMISVGNIGLIKAAQRFDETKGFKFISFAVWWIRQCILQANQEGKRMIRLPGNQVIGIMKINKALEVLEQELQRLPTNQELAMSTDLPEDKIIDYQMNSPMTYSLDMKTNDETELGLMDTLANENSPAADASLIEESNRHNINIMLNLLPKRQQKILKLFFGLDGTKLTLDDMVEILNLSKERIRQLKDNGLKTIRSKCENTHLAYNW